MRRFHCKINLKAYQIGGMCWYAFMNHVSQFSRIAAYFIPSALLTRAVDEFPATIAPYSIGSCPLLEGQIHRNYSVTRLYICNFNWCKASLTTFFIQASQTATMEFAVSDMLCASLSWKLSPLSHQQSVSLKITQSEVAMLNASLNACKETTQLLFSQISIYSEAVRTVLNIINVEMLMSYCWCMLFYMQTDTPLDVIQGFMTNQLFKSEPVTDDEEEIDWSKVPDTEIAIVWKVRGTTRTGDAPPILILHNLYIMCDILVFHHQCRR